MVQHMLRADSTYYHDDETAWLELTSEWIRQGRLAEIDYGCWWTISRTWRIVTAEKW